MRRLWGWVRTLSIRALLGIVSSVAGFAFLAVVGRQRIADAAVAAASAMEDAYFWVVEDNSSLPNWLILLAATLLLLAGCWALSSLVRRYKRARAVTPPLPPVAEAEAWRNRFDDLTDTFLKRRAEFLATGVVRADWHGEYRTLRRRVHEAYEPIRGQFRDYMRGSFEHLPEWPKEPSVFIEDYGDDDSEEGLVEKFWDPPTLQEALDFWDTWKNDRLRALVGERTQYVDHFVAHLKQAPDEPDEPEWWWRRLHVRWRRWRWQRSRLKQLKARRKP